MDTNPAAETTVSAKQLRKTEIRNYQDHLSACLQQIKTSKLPIIILVEGWDSAGKGDLIRELIARIDPRFYHVFCRDAIRDRDRYPFLYPYFNAIPEAGRFLFMDSGWMEDTVIARCRRTLTGPAYDARICSVLDFERQLRDNGYVVIKLFVDISKSEQKKRLNNLASNADTAWRATSEDFWQNRRYGDFSKAYRSFMDATNSITPWYVLNGSKKKQLLHDALEILCKRIDEALEAGTYAGTACEKAFPMLSPAPSLAQADLSLSLSREEYEQELEVLQDRLSRLHNILYRKRIPMVICFEGWDAAGKGGAIRRLASPLDPRGCDVYPIASPEPHELARHYLWRFWQRLPRSGHIAIFDRTWYGRVMVERIEGYCSENDWQRAFNEINEFEQELTQWGAIVLKFWIQIDPDTQLERFEERQNTPEKQWKITDEDWRNREKWPQYETAVSEMLEKTSTTYAPWHIIESKDKLYSRIKVLRLVTQAMEDAIGEDENE